MAVDDLVKLKDELQPGVPTSQLERAADLREGRIAVFLKPGRAIVAIPPLPVLEDIARAFGCDVRDVVERFAAHLGIPWGGPAETDDSLSPDERLLLRRYRDMPASSRTTLLRAAQAMNGGV